MHSILDRKFGVYKTANMGITISNKHSIDMKIKEKQMLHTTSGGKIIIKSR